MAYKRLELITGAGELPGDVWLYLCDAEADVAATLPDEAVMLLVATPDAGKSCARVRKTDGSWAEVGA